MRQLDLTYKYLAKSLMVHCKLVSEEVKETTELFLEPNTFLKIYCTPCEKVIFFILKKQYYICIQKINVGHAISW